VGYYIINYADGTKEKIPLEYSRMIATIDNEFGAYWADPVYQVTEVEEKIIKGLTSDTVSRKVSECSVVFCYEWKNPWPDKLIESISVESREGMPGGIQLFAITGLY